MAENKKGRLEIGGQKYKIEMLVLDAKTSVETAAPPSRNWSLRIRYHSNLVIRPWMPGTWSLRPTKWQL